MLQNVDKTGENNGREIIEQMKNMRKRRHAKDTSVERNEVPEFAFVDCKASGSVSSERKSATKRRSFSFKEKILILKELDTESIASVCDKFSLNDRTLRKWTTKRGEIEKACERESFKNLKKNRTVAYQDLEDALYAWFLQARKNGLPVSGTILKNKALTLNNEMGGNRTFKASEGWLNRWKRRKEVRSLKTTGEKFSTDVEAWKKYKTDFANILNDKQLTRAQVFSLDETGLSYKSLPPKKMVKNDKAQAALSKSQRERVTIGVCTNADGSLKLRVVVIGKSARPRTIKNLSKDRLPAFYKNEKNSVMDATIFEDWFKTEFVPQVRVFLRRINLPSKALLVLNNHELRKNFFKIGEIETTFLPTDVNSVIHPQDQTILDILKRDYKYRLLTSIFNAQENNLPLNEQLKKITIKETIWWISLAWDEITPAAVYNAWKKIWPVETQIFVTQTENMKATMLILDSPVRAQSGESLAGGERRTSEEVFKILQRIKGYESVNENEARNWITAVEYWAKDQEFSDPEIVAQVRRANDEGT